MSTHPENERPRSSRPQSSPSISNNSANHPDGSTMDHSEEFSNASKSALYAIGALSHDERLELEGRVAAGEIDAALLHADCETIAALCQDIASTMPAPRKALKQRIMDAIAGLAAEETAKQTATQPADRSGSAEAPDADEQTLIRVDEGEWNEALPGVLTKTLYVDPASGRTTFMARLAAGATYPDHRHHGIEEVTVIEGGLYLGGATMYAGDYSVSLADSTHHRVYSPNGCLCVVSSMMNDEFLG